MSITPRAVVRRDGSTSPFDPSKISVAMTKAFLDVEGAQATDSTRIHETVADLTEQVVASLTRRNEPSQAIHIEDIQDQVELALMRGGHHKVAREYVLYREEHARAREAKERRAPVAEPTIHVKDADGELRPLDSARLTSLVEEACADLPGTSAEAVLTGIQRNVYDGMSLAELELATIMAARTFVENDPDYAYVSARLLLDKLRREALTFLANRPDEASQQEMADRYADYFQAYVRRAVDLELLDPELGRFDLARVGAALRPERDLDFAFLGLQTLYDRYVLHSDGVRFELPQAFLMRVAMGLAAADGVGERAQEATSGHRRWSAGRGETERGRTGHGNLSAREDRAIEFYDLLSSFDFMSSTPTLFNSGTTRPQLSSCFLTTVADDLDGIFSAVKNNALLSKYAGGLGNDWTPVRGMGAHIKGTNGASQGLVPFLKIANDTAVAVNQCFAPDTLIYTADGVKAIRDVHEGDLVLGNSGKYREVTQTFVYDQVDPMVEVNVKHSIEPLRVTAGHPLYAIQGVPMEQSATRTLEWLDKGKVGPDWLEAGDLRKGDYIAQVIPEEIVPIPGLTDDDARLYGILLGDGHPSKGSLQWGVSGNPQRDAHLDFVRRYLTERDVHFWESGRGDSYRQIHWATGELALPFDRDDLYDEEHNKRISRRFSHLPRAQTLALLRGLLESDGGASQGSEIYFTTTSRPLAAGLRYQLLRLGVPSAGQINFSGTTNAFDIRVPAVPEIAELVGCRPLHKRNWIEYGGMLFSRVREVRDTPVTPTVFDLEVEADESYMTVAGLAHNGGKRKGAACAYLETWHIDIEEFLDLRKNTGDERRRTHDMNTANWVPDLFLQRVEADAEWTLFSPDEVPDLHDLYGKPFAERYAEYEAKAERGEIRIFKRVRAVELWRRMLTMLFETGHPWITFKDPCNIRSPQGHVGVVHSSNLCTEITLNTDVDEVAVCNLGSVNLANHIGPDGLDEQRLSRTVETAVRMLDNVIDINYYTIPEAKRSNLRHRPVGLGLMGFSDALFELGIPYASEAAVEFADRSMELIGYHAIKASSDLASERGSYPSFDGSLWSKGILPIDSLNLVGEQRGGDYAVETSVRLDWDELRERVRTTGMRNSNVMAIAPTATISNICGVGQSIEPLYRNLFVKSNMSGDFTVINPYLVRDLKARGLWDEVMVSDLKYFDGSLGPIDRVPDDLKALYATAFEIDPTWLVEAAARRQKWIDQSQSLNLYVSEPSGRKLDELYRLAWRRGLKTTYYLRSQSATHVEKSTLKGTDGKLNAVSPVISTQPEPPATDASVCSIDNPDCEACQ